MLIAFIAAAQLSEVLPVETDESGVAGVDLIGFAGPHGCVCPGFPAWILVAQLQVLPEALELVVALGAQCTISFSGAGGTMRQNLSNLIFEGILRGKRNCIFNLLHEGHVAELEHVQVEETDFLVRQMLTARKLGAVIVVWE